MANEKQYAIVDIGENDTLNVRTGSTDTSKIIGTAKNGDKFEVLSKITDQQGARFIAIRYKDGTKRYLMKKYVKMVSEK